MPRRGENIRKRKDGRWEARCPAGVTISGKTAYRSVYARSYKEVKEKRRQLQLLLSEPEPVPSGSITVRELLERWLDSAQIGLKEASVYRYRYLLDKHILPVLGQLRAEQLTGARLSAFAEQKLKHGRLDGKGGLSAAYVRSILLVLHAGLSFGVQEGLCAPPRGKTSKPLIPPKELPVLSREDQQKLEQVLLTGMDETKLGIYISLYTGLRIGEVCALSWEDIDLPGHLLHVRHTVVRTGRDGQSGTQLKLDHPKTAASRRTIPICSKLCCVLQACGAGRDTDFVVSGCGAFLSPRTFDYRYHRLLEKNHLPSVNYHALRHTFATRCVEAGVDVKSLSEVLGHASVAVTLNTYVHSSLELKRTQLEKLTAGGN